MYKDKGKTQTSGYCDADLARSPIDRRYISRYCDLIGGNIISWKSKKQNVFVRFSAEAEYRAKASFTYELVWVKQFPQELKSCEIQQMKMYCHNQDLVHIASNLVFYKRTKHIELDCHFIWKKLLSKEFVHQIQ